MRTKIPRCALVLLGLALAGSAQAQWKWLDSAGQVNYSDHPPPVSVPATRILSQGGTLRAAQAAATAGSGSTGSAAQDARAAAGAGAALAQQAASAAPGSAAAAPANSPASTTALPSDKAGSATPGKPRTAAERLNDLRRQQALKEAAEREAEQQQRAQAGTAQWCEEMRGRERMLESGMRMARVDSGGAQSVLSDEERATQLQAIRRDLAAQCASGT